MYNNTKENLTTVGAVNKVTCKAPANYYPCLSSGKTTSVHIPSGMWDSMEWQIKSNGYNPTSVFMIIALRKNSALDARISVVYNVNTGHINSVCYQGNQSFDESSMFDLDTLKFEKRKQKLAGYAAQNLIQYFRDINAMEYAKALEEREMRNFVATANGVAAEQHDKKAKKTTARTPATEKVYDPNADKSVAYVGTNKKSRAPYQFVVETWERHGHYRHYANGRIVYIKPTIMHRRKKVAIPTT